MNWLIFSFTIFLCVMTSSQSKIMQDLSSLTRINLQQNNLTILPDILDLIPNLRILDLGSNKLKVIEADAFHGVRNLRLLNIWRNHLIEIKPRAFDHMTLLTSLDLHTNFLRNLPSQLFKKLTKLRVINLTQNNFTSDAFSDDLLKGLKSLEMVMIMNNRQNITTLPNGFFSNLKNLTAVKMQRSGFIYLPENLFWGSKKLRNLSMEWNFIQTIPQNLFRDCKNLKTLNLSFNKLNYLPDNIFSSLTKLQSLDLSNNHIKHIKPNMLNGLSSLHVIHMTGNGLVSIDRHAFQSLQRLRILHFEHNKLTLQNYSSFYTNQLGTYSPFYHCLKTVEEMHFNYNNISEIFTDWMAASHLKIVNLTHNTLQLIHPTNLHFSSHSKVRIDLTYNEIKWISFVGADTLAQNHHRPRHITVDIQNNPLSCDCDLYDLLRFREHKFNPNVENLFKLKLGKSECSEPEQLKGVSISDFNSDTLKCDFIKSQITNATCPDSCKCYKRPSNQAYIIDCSNSGLTSAPNLTHTFNGRVEINLSGNNLKSLPPLNQPGYIEVAILNLSNNSIMEINDNLVMLKNLEYLDLTDNSLTQIHSQVLHHWMDDNSTLKNLNLQRNPWTCDCQSRDFVNFIQKMHVEFSHLQNVTCHNTDELIFEITAIKLCPPLIIGIIIVLFLSVSLLGIVIGGVLILYYHYEHNIQNYVSDDNLSQFEIIEEEKVDKDKIYDVFISFSLNDREFITNELVPNLENGFSQFKLCINYQDYTADEWVSHNIAQSIKQSRRTIVVVSQNWLECVRGKLEFRTAYNQEQLDGIERVVVVLYGDIKSMEDLDPYLKTFIDAEACVRWGDPWFWEKLRYALPRTVNSAEKLQIKVIY